MNLVMDCFALARGRVHDHLKPSSWIGSQPFKPYPGVAILSAGIGMAECKAGLTSTEGMRVEEHFMKGRLECQHVPTYNEKLESKYENEEQQRSLHTLLSQHFRLLSYFCFSSSFIRTLIDPRLTQIEMKAATLASQIRAH